MSVGGWVGGWVGAGAASEEEPPTSTTEEASDNRQSQLAHHPTSTIHTIQILRTGRQKMRPDEKLKAAVGWIIL